MNDNAHPLSRRRLLAGAAAASAATVAGVTGTPAAAAAGSAHTAARSSPARPDAPLVTRDRIATALLRAPGAGPAAARFQADFHERLDAWLAFWSANSPRAWSTPVEVVGRVHPGGDAFTLHAIRYRFDDAPRDGFTAGRVDAAHWATLASLHHHFPLVRPLAGGGVQVVDGPAGFTGSTAQVAFAVAACRELWGDRSTTTTGWREHANRVLARAGHPADAATRAGWAAFTRTTLRSGLGTESYDQSEVSHVA